MKQRIYNSHLLEFFDDSNNCKAIIKVSGSDLILNPVDSSGTVIIGEAGAINDIEVGDAGTAVDFTFLGGGTFTSNGGTLVIGCTGDTIDLSNTTIPVITASIFQGGSFNGDGSGLTGVVGTTGTPADNQIAVFTDSSTVEGTSGLTYDGSTLVVGGNITANTITAEQFNTSIVSASVTFQSGSTKFGDTVDDIHDFTGSVFIQGNYLNLAHGSPTIQLQDTSDDDDQKIRFLNNGGSIEYVIQTQDFTSGGGGDGLSIGSISSDPIRFATANTTALTIDTSQKVGIGTSSPSEKLTVAGNISASGEVNINIKDALFSSKLTIGGDAYSTGGFKVGTGATFVGKLVNDSGRLTLMSDSNRDIQFGSNNDASIVFLDTSEKKLGIGSTNPTGSLHVSGAGYFAGGTVDVGDCKTDVGLVINENDYIYTKDSCQYLRQLIGKNSSDSIVVGQSGTSLIDRIDLMPGSTGGCVRIFNDSSVTAIFTGSCFAIGDTTPARQLEVRNSSGLGEVAITGTTGARLYFRPDNAYTDGGNFGIFVTGTSSSPYTSTMCILGYGGSVNTIMTLKGDKKVGIAQPSPDDVLHVSQSTTAFRGITIEGPTPALYLTDTGATSAHHIGSNQNFLYFLRDTDKNGTYNNIAGYFDDSDRFVANCGLTLTTSCVVNAGADTDKFLVLDSNGHVDFRTGEEVLSDIGGQGSGNYVVDAGGSARQVGVWSSFTDLSGSDSFVYNAGKVGIGSATPVNTLEVRGPALVGGTTMSIDNSFGESTKVLAFTYNQTTQVAKLIGYGRNSTSTLPYFAVEVNNSTTSTASHKTTERLRILANGNVGIGTTSPSKKLHVAGDTQIDAGATGQTLLLGRANGQPTIKAQTDQGGYLILDSTSNFLSLNHYVNQDVIMGNGGGNVGIGTTAPSNKLEVAGNLAVSQSAGGNAGIKIITRNDAEAFLIMGDPDDNSMGGLAYNNSTNALSIDVNNAERMTILGSGKVGIGTTSPTKELHIQPAKSDNCILVSASAGAFLGLDSNAAGYQGIQWDSKGSGCWYVGIYNDNANLNSGDFAIVRGAKTNGIPAVKFDTFRNATLSGSVTVSGSTILGETTSHSVTIKGLVTDLPSNGQLRWGSGDAEIREGLDDNYSLSLRTYDGSTLSTALKAFGNNDVCIFGDLTVGINNTNCSLISSSILAGHGNCISGSVEMSALAGGCNNTIKSNQSFIGAGKSNTTCCAFGFIGAGRENTVGNDGFIGAGRANTINADSSARCSGIVAGYANKIEHCQSFIGAGQNNLTKCCNSAVVAGVYNSGSGCCSFIGAGNNNKVTAQSGVVVGGCENVACQYQFSFIGGGSCNCICNSAQSAASVIVGGHCNTMIGSTSFNCNVIVGGSFNSTNCNRTFIGGGCCNSVTATGGVVVGGSKNCISGTCAAIVAGVSNTGSGACSFIGGGQDNAVITSCYSSIVGGYKNCISSGETFSVIGGGCSNIVDGDFSSIVGGRANTIKNNCSFIGSGCTNIVCGYLSFVGGGQCNRVCSGTNWSVIAGGCCNSVQGCVHNTIGGGALNCIAATQYGTANTIAGGQCNKICGTNSESNNFIGGGCCNTISSDADLVVIGGGAKNTNTGHIGVIVGGVNNTGSGACSGILGGKNNYVNHANSMIIGSDLTSTADCYTFMNNACIAGTTRTNALVETSAKKHKECVEPLQDQLNNIKKLSPIEFQWKKDKVKDIGFIAEEVEKIYPNLIAYEEDGEIHGLQYSKLTSILVKAVQEQQDQIEELKKEIFILKEKL